MDEAEKSKMSWQERRKKIKHKWAVAFVFIEWKCEWLSGLLERSAFFEVLEYVGRLTILVAVVFYFAESGSRRKAKHYQAWQVINSAQGKTGSGGRMDALQDLCSDGISLAGVDISKAYLPKLNLENADILKANLTEADLQRANLAGAFLMDANLDGAILYDADLAGAILHHANLTGAVLTGANLAEANLYDANLTGASLRGANLTGAFLTDANLAVAILKRSNLRDIKNWQEIQSIELANIYGVKTPPDGFIEWAKEQGAVSIEDDKEWKELIRKKMEEKMKQEAGNSRGNQKKAGDK